MAQESQRAEDTSSVKQQQPARESLSPSASSGNLLDLYASEVGSTVDEDALQLSRFLPNQQKQRILQLQRAKGNRYTADVVSALKGIQRTINSALVPTETSALATPAASSSSVLPVQRESQEVAAVEEPMEREEIGSAPQGGSISFTPPADPNQNSSSDPIQRVTVAEVPVTPSPVPVDISPEQEAELKRKDAEKEGVAAKQDPSTPRVAGAETVAAGETATPAAPSQAQPQAGEQAKTQLPGAPVGAQPQDGEQAKTQLPGAPVGAQPQPEKQDAGAAKPEGAPQMSVEPTVAAPQAGPTADPGKAPTEASPAVPQKAETPEVKAVQAKAKEVMAQPSASEKVGEAAAGSEKAEESAEEPAEGGMEKGKAGARPGMAQLSPEQSNQALDAAVSEVEMLRSGRIQFAPDPVENMEATAEGEAQSEVQRSPRDGAMTVDPQVLRIQTEDMATEFLTRNASGATRLAAVGKNAQPILDSAAQNAITAIQNAIKKNVEQVDKEAAAVRDSVERKYKETQSGIDKKFTETKGGIEKATKDARATIEDDFKAKLKDLEALQKTKATAIDTRFTQAEGELRTAGKNVGKKAIEEGESKKKKFERELGGRKGDMLDGEDYYERQLEAKKQAADQVAKAYEQELIKEGEGAAGQVKGGIKDVTNELKGKLDGARTLLEEERKGALTALEESQKAAIKQAEDTQRTQSAALKESRKQTLNSIAKEAESTKRIIRETGAQHIGSIEGSVGQVIAGVQEATTNAVKSLGMALRKLADGLAAMPAPDPKDLERVLGVAQANINGVYAGLESQLYGQITTNEKEFNQRGTAVSTQLDDMAVSAKSALEPMGTSFTDGAKELMASATAQYTQALKSHETGAKTRADDAKGTFGAVYKQAETDATEILTCLDKGLKQFVTDFEKGPEGLPKALKQLGPDIEKEATSAAKQVPPRWKKIVGFVLKIIIAVVVAVAIAALVASGVGLGLGLLLAAGIGALGKVADKVVDNVFNKGASTLSEVFDGTLKAAAVGALEGMLAFAGGRYLKSLGQMALKKQVGMNILMDTGADMVSKTVELGLDGNLSFRTLGVTFVEVIVTSTLTNLTMGVGFKYLKDRPKTKSDWAAFKGGYDKTPAGHRWNTSANGKPYTMRIDADAGPRLVPHPKKPGEFVPVPTTKTEKALFDQNLPNAPAGHHWSSKNGKPYLKRNKGYDGPKITHTTDAMGTNRLIYDTGKAVNGSQILGDIKGKKWSKAWDNTKKYASQTWSSQKGVGVMDDFKSGFKEGSIGKGAGDNWGKESAKKIYEANSKTGTDAVLGGSSETVTGNMSLAKNAQEAADKAVVPTGQFHYEGVDKDE